MLANALLSLASPIGLSPKQSQSSVNLQARALALTNAYEIQFGSLQRQSSQPTPLDVVDPLKAERPYGLRFRLLGRILERVTSQAKRNDYEFRHLSPPQQWINIAARIQRDLTKLETQYTKQMNQLSDEIVNQQRLAAFMQRELDIYLAAQASNPEASTEPDRAERLMGQPSDSLDIEIEFHQRGLGMAKHDEGILTSRKKELQELFIQQFVAASQSLAILEKQFEQMTGKTLRNPRKEYRILLMKDERTVPEEARFRALIKEIWGEI